MAKSKRLNLLMMSSMEKYRINAATLEATNRTTSRPVSRTIAYSLDR
jgi:hypothetical protein